MKTVVKVGGFALGLAAVFATALAVGSAVGPVPDAANAAEATAPAGSADPMAGMNDGNPAELPGGLMSSQDGYTLQLGKRSLPAGPRIRKSTEVCGPAGSERLPSCRV